MTVGEGVNIASELRIDPPVSSRPSSVLSRVFSGYKAELPFVPTVAEYGSALGHLTQLIRKHTALYYTTIVSTECYSEPIRLGIVHRFIILALARPGKKTIWLRLDRRRSKRVGVFRFLRSAGSTPAYDTVNCSKISMFLLLC